jgi:molybdopterin-containing oxidoreductase family iron-sulfur binding subunit
VGDSKKRRLDLVPDDASAVTRRAWFKLLAAGLAAAGAAGCTRERGEKILPYVKAPPHLTPGVPRYYATSLTLDGFATGVLVQSHDGRPTKIEGNPDHPASLGATTAIDQAAVLGLYDPDRAGACRTPRGPSPVEPLFARFGGERADRGAGLRFLLEPTGSPLLRALVGRVRERFPRARFTFHAPTGRGAAVEGARLAFGAPAQPLHDFSAARVVLSLADDFLASGPFSVPYARQFASRRRVSAPEGEMNRLYVAETMLTPTGSMADHRLRRRPSEIAILAARLCAEVARAPGGPPGPVPAAVRAALRRFRGPDPDPTVRALAQDLAAHAGAGVVTVGAGQPPVVHALGHLLDAMLGNERVTWGIAPTLVGAGDAEQDLGALAAELAAGAVDTLAILGGNPVYSAPADLELSRALRTVDAVLYLGAYEDETAALAGWFVPAAHALESWGDAAAYDGTLSLVQPLIAPLAGGRTVAEVLALFAGVDHPDARALLESHWSKQRPSDFEAFWQHALTAGVIAGTASPRLSRALAGDALAAAITALPLSPGGDALEVSFAPDPCVHDGRFTNNPWLLEQPQPLTKLTWENAALLAPRTAARLGLAGEDLVELTLGGRTVRAPVLVVPGHADDAVTLHLGWGRTGAETLARGAGFDAYRLRTAAAPSFAPGLVVRKIPGARHQLALAQTELRAQGRPLAPVATLAEYRAEPGFTADLKGAELSLFALPVREGVQWAMTIDTSICTGCSACVIACQAENNVLVVGKEEVARGRHMAWIRIDTYQRGPVEAPRTVHEPMLCQHCEAAPCEYVCPVNATVHSGDGLNEMVYNRCVGTRFCSNNCPYKVRRFNWFDWNEEQEANHGRVTLQHNPDVTVRQRGVMEKCTYCVQRIREAEIHARVEDREIRPGEVVTACQQACPTEAIQFGSLSHPGTKMMEWRAEPRSFAVLHDLGTRPRTLYLARIDNPHPEIG